MQGDMNILTRELPHLACLNVKHEDIGAGAGCYVLLVNVHANYCQKEHCQKKSAKEKIVDRENLSKIEV